MSDGIAQLPPSRLFGLVWRTGLARLRGEYDLDEWGADAQLMDTVDGLARLVLRVTVDGADHLPEVGPAVLVANRRFGLAEPLAVGLGVRRETGRRVRFVGMPDVAPVGTVLRRLGTAVDRPEELAGLLRAGQLVGIPLAWHPRFGPPRAGNLLPETVGPAVALDAPVLPVAVVGGELSGHWRIFIGEPVRRPVSRGPLALAELADGARAGVQALLDEAFPPTGLFG